MNKNIFKAIVVAFNNLAIYHSGFTILTIVIASFLLLCCACINPDLATTLFFTIGLIIIAIWLGYLITEAINNFSGME